VALGSNIEAAANLRSAVQWLAATFSLVAVSRVYRTPPWGGVAQADFLNAAAQVRTVLSPEALLEALLARELAQGRVRSVPNGPRTLDLDLHRSDLQAFLVHHAMQPPCHRPRR